MSRPARFIVACFLCLALPSLVLVPAATAQAPAAKLEVLGHLPQDALFVWAAEEESLAADVDEMLGLIQRFMPPEAADGGMDVGGLLDQADEMLGISLRNDLLARIGPEMAMVIDLPPLDSLMGLAMNQSPEMIDQAFGRLGMIFQVREQKAFEEALTTALANLEFTATVSDDGIWKLAAPSAGEGAPEMAVYWRIEDGWMTMGAGPTWPTAAANPLPAGEGFTDGADFRRVMGHLDKDTTSLLYLNLPKLGQLVSNSAVLQGALQGRPQIAEAVNWLVRDELTMGWAQTKVDIGGGVRSSTFGPSILMDGGLSLGILAASVGAGIEEAVGQAEKMAAGESGAESTEEGDAEEMDEPMEAGEADGTS